MILGIMGAFTLVLVYAVISYLSVNIISDETIILRELSEDTLLLLGDINGMAVNSLQGQYDQVKESKLKFDEGFLEIKELKYLPDLDSDIADALEIIGKLEELFSKAWVDFEKSTDLVILDANRTLYSANVKLSALSTSPLIQKTDEKLIIMIHVTKLTKAISFTVNNLSAAYDVMFEQYGKIDKEIEQKESFLIYSVLLTIVVVFFITLIISLKLTKRISVSIKALEMGLSAVQKGDLTTQIEIKTKDEVGRLGRSMNIFTSELSESMRQIKSLSGNNIEIKEELQVTTVQTSSAAHQITENINGIKETIGGLDKSIKDSTQEVGIVKLSIEGLNSMIQEQITMVEESTASVTEMITAIGSISDIAARKREATLNLVKTAKEGGKKLTQTNGLIQEITFSVDEIRGIAGIIQNVAAQTSLLSMNAAIEAAHAGEYGRGFAVVADEIGKLAETSGKNSKKIGQVLKDVVEKIESVSTSGDETRKAFVDIDSEVADVSSSFDEITAGMNEINIGSQQILQAMTNLQDYSIQVQESSSSMNKSSDHLRDSVGIVERVSQEVLGSISEASAGITEISTAMSSLTDMSDSLNKIAENLNSEINRFQTDDSVAVGNDEFIPEEINDLV